MKIKILAVLLLLVGCAPPPPYPSSAPLDNTSAPPPVESPSMPSSNAAKDTNTLSRDASDCERQAALSTAGNKAQAFNNCMKARRARN
jgi:hypothetical protein